MKTGVFYRAAAPAALLFAILGPSRGAEALDRRVNIINETSYDIVHFYASNVARKKWEEDILGDDILKAGGSVRVNFDDGSGYCIFDFRAVFEDGDELVKNKVNICDLGTFRYTE